MLDRSPDEVQAGVQAVLDEEYSFGSDDLPTIRAWVGRGVVAEETIDDVVASLKERRKARAYKGTLRRSWVAQALLTSLAEHLRSADV